MIPCSCQQPPNEAQPSEAKPESSSTQSVAINDTTRQAQNTMEEQQQQQQSQGHGSNQQEGSEGHSGISNVTQNESEGRTEKKVIKFLGLFEFHSMIISYIHGFNV